MNPDRDYMARALALAEQGLYSTDPNPQVGAVIVKDGQIIGEGYHVQAGTPHAEVHALSQAGEAARGATCYVTLEPCSHFGRTPPCADALIKAGLARVVVAMEDPNPLVSGQGIARLRQAGIQVEVGLLSEDAAALNPGFISRMRRGRPWVRLKLAASVDGRTALSNGASQWITGPEARADVHRLRARSSAIVTGIGTVLADDPRLNPRLDTPLHRQPWRVILDRELRTPVQARLFQAPGPVMICHGPGVPRLHKSVLQELGAQLELLPESGGTLDLAAFWHLLNTLEMNEILVEAGPTLAGTLITGGWVDELVLYLAPRLLGPDAMPLARLPVFEDLTQVPDFRLRDCQVLGNDVRLTLDSRR